MIATESRLRSVLLPKEELSEGVKREMCELLASCFEGVTEEGFEADLAEKNWVILLRNEEGLVGFSTIHAYEASYSGETINVIYSGDTIVSPNAWGTSVLPRSWIAGVNGILAQMSGSRSFWLLLSSGFRTYRFLPLFWREFYPVFERATPVATAKLLDSLARHRFGPRFDGTVVRLANPQRLRAKLCEVPEERLRDPHVAYFLKANPGHDQGDELVCLTELHPGNLTRAGVRMTRGDGHSS